MKVDYEWIKSSRGAFGGIEDSGWKRLIEQLLADLDPIMADSERILFLEQVKEKFGGLRFYCQVSDLNGNAVNRADVDELVGRAERQSEKTCIRCGEPGEMVDVRGWHRPLCVKHAEESKKRVK